MADIEPLKPSNTGWLVADVVRNTFAFGWTRTQAEPALLALLSDPQWQPYVVFPGDFVDPLRVVTGLEQSNSSATPASPSEKRPLFILLDATWPEARRMFRKSPYLDKLPVLGLQSDQLSRYRLRQSANALHLCTAEVAALCLGLSGDQHTGQLLGAYLDVFTNHYLQAKHQLPVDPADAVHEQLRSLSTKNAPYGAFLSTQTAG
jgi:DTW domain-containing protein YfiP